MCHCRPRLQGHLTYQVRVICLRTVGDTFLKLKGRREFFWIIGPTALAIFLPPPAPHRTPPHTSQLQISPP